MRKDENTGIITLIIVVVFIAVGGFLSVAIFQSKNEKAEEQSPLPEKLHPPINPNIDQSVSDISNNGNTGKYQGEILDGN